MVTFGEMIQNDYIWDPLRRKSVRGMHVPEHMMGSEVAFKHGAKEYRADIVVYDRAARPLMLVECKRPEVTLDQEVVDQAIRYCNELEVSYIVITNGTKTFIFERTRDGWQFMTKAPLWEEMLPGAV